MSVSSAPPLPTSPSAAPAPVAASPSRDVSIAELDGLRGIACLTVVFGHFDAVTERVSFFPAWHAAVTTLNGSMGVICFFTLSGFLLTYLAALEFRRTGGFDVWAFYVRRVFRIWPLHFTVLATVMLLAAPFGPLAIDGRAYQWCVEHLWTYALFLNNWSLAFYGVGGHVDLSPPMLNISWSIAIEEQIYLLFPLVMLGVLGAGRRRQLVVIAIVLGVAIGYRLVALLWWGPSQPGRAGTIYLGTPSYLDVVLAGGLAGWLCARRRLLGPEDGPRRPLPAWLGPAVLVGLGAVSLAWRYIETVGSTPLDVVVYPLMGAVFGGGMLWIAERPRSWLARALRWPPLRVLGTLSFGIYLWHFTARTVTYRAFDLLHFRPRGQEQTDLLVLFTLVTYLALSVLLATLSYTLVERRFLALRHRLSQRGAAERAARPRPRPGSPGARRTAPAPRAIPLLAACCAVATVGLGLAQLFVRR